MSSINFDNPYLLFIAIPLLALLIVPFFIAVKRDNRNGHNVASMVLHVLMALLIAFAAAGTSMTTVITETNVYVVADVSYSASKNLDTIDGYIADLKAGLPRNSKLGVVCFGKDCKVTTKLGGSLKAVKNSGVDDSETNITKALEFTGNLFKSDVIKRIVLITDGRQTYTSDSDELVRTVADLQAKGVKVDAIYLDDNLDLTAKEVQISSAEYTKNAYLGREETVSFALDSSYMTNCIVTLYKDGEEYYERSVTLSRGTNTVSFDLDTSEEGEFDYKAEISVSEDECNFNNTFSFTQNVSKAIKVLAITADVKNNSDKVICTGGQTYDKIRALYDENTEITHFNLSVTKTVPVGIEEICEYDEIILCDADLTEIENYEMFLSSLDTAISFFGKSLLTFGNLGIQSKTDGELKQLDDILPVRYGDVTGRPKLYTIVLDVSHSMSISSRMVLAKQAAIQLVNFLGEDDYVSVITFSGSAQLALTPTSLVNKEEVLSVFENIIFGQGTITSIGMKLAMDTIKNLAFSEKQVMLITDGLPFDGDISYEDVDFEGAENDKKYAAGFAEQMYLAYGITTSVLQVGSQNDEHKDWLMSLASSANGNYNYAATEDELANVLFGEIAKDVKPPVVEVETLVKIDKPRDESLSFTVTDDDGVESTSYLELSGNYVERYSLGSTKSGATNVLSVNYKVSGITYPVPLYSYWNYGNGKVFTFTGEISGLKSGAGNVSEDNATFFENMISASTPSERISIPFVLSASLDGKRARVEISPAQLHTSATASITITTPSGETLTDNFIFDSSVYYYEFITPDTGKYSFAVTYSYGGTDYTTQSDVTLSYAPEYDSFATYSSSVLYKMLNGNGTVSEDGKLSLQNAENEVSMFTIHFTLPFLAVAVALYVIDIIIRKLKWNDVVSLFGRVRGKKDSTKGKK